MDHVNQGNRAIAKNTLFMFVRMFYSMVISLFTTRYVLSALGEVDYGIYNVVGSVVSMFIFLHTVMGAAVYRYIAFALGEKNEKKLNEIYSTSLIIHFTIAAIIVILCETIGLWFFYKKLVIPEERLTAAMWCYQISIIVCALNIISAPYISEIVAHEKLNVYAFTQIITSSLNLLVAFVLLHTSYDRLVIYSLLLLFIGIGSRVFFGIYCGRTFSECRFRFPKNKSLFKELTSYAGWTLLRHMAKVFYTQGTNILLNIFCGPVVNAAKGLALYVQNAAYGFVSNFQTAARPQITKSYAAGEKDRMLNLIVFVSKISIFLLLILMMPVFLETPRILDLWLGKTPEHTVNFIRISILMMFVTALDFPLGNAIEATGNIKKYNIAVSAINITIVLFSYISLKINGVPELVFVIQLCVLATSCMVKLLIVRHQIQLSIRNYLKKIVFPFVLVSTLSLIFPFSLYIIMPDTWLSFMIICVLCLLSTAVFIYYLGLDYAEREKVLGMVMSFIEKLKKGLISR